MLPKLLAYLEEDVGERDITTASILRAKKIVRARVIAKDSGVLAGLEDAKLLLKHFGISRSSRLKDGSRLRKGDVVLNITGDASALLTLERLLLNLLMRMSGIATATSQLAAKCRRYGVRVTGTRKTTPGFREFEKKAIALGGGLPHRMRLDEAVLIKDNHVALVGLEKAIKEARKGNLNRPIEVEVSTLRDTLRACELGADIVMLDNMPPKEVKKAMKVLVEKKYRERVLVEISGGITPENIEKYARLRPDVISTGYVTTKAPWLDMSLEVMGG